MSHHISLWTLALFLILFSVSTIYVVTVKERFLYNRFNTVMQPYEAIVYSQSFMNTTCHHWLMVTLLMWSYLLKMFASVYHSRNWKLWGHIVNTITIVPCHNSEAFRIPHPTITQLDPNPTDPRQVLCLTWKVPLSRASGLGKLN